ncbi:MAG: PepSY-associated TM helix domain-containing protein, partial [Comamonadaceae bacterium]|nr:PepSY-associated TM helix domain-containing protein [Comamonadaceae bacterium]
MKAAHPREANAPLFANFRQAMTWVHTWFGLTLGFVLMACFFFGTLAVFDREIDRWAIPATRFAPQPMPSFDTVLRPAYEALQARAEADAASLNSGTGTGALQAQRLWAYATHRDPVLSIGAAFAAPEAAQAQHFARASLDPRSGALLPGGALAIGSDWFYPMHYHLNWPWMNLGYWLVGLAGVVMLVALVTGV